MLAVFVLKFQKVILCSFLCF